ncbi:hypothetical protein BOX30_04225 [Leptospirillum ferriphilum]|nr:hypothetical protein BOX30_04225 [Leptospirillum ferriphilum]
MFRQLSSVLVSPRQKCPVFEKTMGFLSGAPGAWSGSLCEAGTIFSRAGPSTTFFRSCSFVFGRVRHR